MFQYSAILVLIIVIFLYGFVKIVMTKSPLYLKFFIFAIGTLILGGVFDVLCFIAPIPKSPLFTVSLFSTFGCFLFFLSANYGIMDRIVDDRSKKYKKIRCLAFIAPIFYSILIFLLLISTSHIIKSLPYVISVLPIIPASYFSFKLLIFKIKKSSFLNVIRKIHVFSLLFYFFYILFLFTYENDTIYLISNIGVAVSLIGLIYAIEKGRKVWSI